MQVRMVPPCEITSAASPAAPEARAMSFMAATIRAATSAFGPPPPPRPAAPRRRLGLRLAARRRRAPVGQVAGPRLGVAFGALVARQALEAAEPALAQ